jgi:hypothetical protein
MLTPSVCQPAKFTEWYFYCNPCFTKWAYISNVDAECPPSQYQKSKLGKKSNTKAGTLTVSPMHIGNWSFGTTQNMCATLAEELTFTVIMSKHPTNMGDSA